MCPSAQQLTRAGSQPHIGLRDLPPIEDGATGAWLDSTLCIDSANAARVVAAKPASKSASAGGATNDAGAGADADADAGAGGLLHYSTLNWPTVRIIRGAASPALRVPGWVVKPLQLLLHDDRNPTGTLKPRALLGAKYTDKEAREVLAIVRFLVDIRVLHG